jgi:ribulose-5-phosphate 4-epimerase/fuculose-1-phosphate aldolase
MKGADIVFLGNHGVVVCADRMDYAYDDLYYLERACELEVLARSTGQKLIGVEEGMAKSVSDQTLGERLQSELFFKALKRVL